MAYISKYLKAHSVSLQTKAAVWYLICNFLQKGISLISVPLYTRLLTTDQYGAYQVFCSWVEIFEIITTLRLSWGEYPVGLVKFTEDRDRFTSSMQCMSITVTTVFLLLYLLFSDLINRITGMTTGLTLLLFVLMYAIPATGFWSGRNRVEFRYHAVVAVTLVSSFLIPVLGLGSILLTDWGEVGIIAARVLVHGIIGGILLWINCRRDFAFYNRKYWVRAIRINLPLLPHYLSTVILNSSDRIMIERLIGQGEAGIYGVAYSAAMVMNMLNSAITSSMQPWLFQRMREHSYEGVSTTVNGSLVLVAGMSLLLIALAPEAIMILAPPAYQEAIWIVPPLAGSVVVMFFYQHFLNIEFYYEKSKLITLASAGAALLNLGLNGWLIPIFGYFAAGYTTLLSYLAFAVVHYIVMRRILKKEGCPTSIADIKGMSLVLIGFFAVAGVLTYSYQFVRLRYMVLITIIAVAVIKRQFLMKILWK